MEKEIISKKRHNIETKIRRDIQNEKIVIALAFGQGKNGEPGKSNEALARVVKEFNKKYNFPIVAQWEIADCIPGFLNHPQDLVIRKHRQEGKYLDTYEVLAQAKIHCDRFGITKAVIVAHQDHAPRCVAVAIKLGFAVETADIAKVPYDPDSTQAWTRDRDYFVNQYEPKAMEYYRQKGYID